jgi:glycosyltransferase 2 family protein
MTDPIAPNPAMPNPASINLKQLLRWSLIAAVLFFLGRSLWQNWQTVAAVQLAPLGWGLLAIALFTSLLAHCLAGAIWAAILRLFQPATATTIPTIWGIRTYLTTNLAKYLPGNVWHFYGRFNACKARQIPAGDALLSILLEPLLMAAAGLVVAIAPRLYQSPIGASPLLPIAQILSLTVVLIGIHPKLLNRVLKQVGGAKRQRLKIAPEQIPQLQRYPLRPLLGELGFVLLRGTGFVLVWCSIHSIVPHQLPVIYSGFAIAWLLGLIVPGLPGGIGLFEAVIIALLNNQLGTGELLVIVALYRVVNTLAEAIGAAVAWQVKPSV